MSQALLLAEAEPGTREFLARHLASDGFAVLGADAGREALELVERERPDLVLVGGLPDAPALEVCRVLREVWGFRSLGRTRTLDSHASRLRRKLARAGAVDCVLNVWGVGYRLIADYEEALSTA